jgi:hypothetical protein
MNLGIKADKKRPHHYLIGVAIHPASNKQNAGQFYVKYGPLYFHHEDIEELQHAVYMVKDKVFKTTNKEAVEMSGRKELILSISSMELAAKFNQCTLHHFSSDVIIDDHYFDTIVKLANTIDSYKELLYKSSIGR